MIICLREKCFFNCVPIVKNDISIVENQEPFCHFIVHLVLIYSSGCVGWVFFFFICSQSRKYSYTYRFTFFTRLKSLSGHFWPLEVKFDIPALSVC